MPRSFSSLLLALTLSLAGCTGAVRGTPLSEVPKPAAVTARATTAEPDGLRVLVTARQKRIAEEGVWLAADEDELRSLWNTVGADGPPPRVDFDTHVVLGSSYLGGACEPEIDTVEVDAAGTLRLRTHLLSDWCIALAVYVAQAIAVPRRILPSRFVFVAPHSRTPYAFDLPAAAPKASAASRVVPPISSLERPSLSAPLGVVALPPHGHIALRTLDDGRAVWVVAHRSGAISVLSADEPAFSDSPWLRKKVEWLSRIGRFGSGHDAAGRSVHGASPLETRVFARQGDGRIAIGEPAPLAPGPIEPRAEAPTLKGSSDPYTDLPLLPLDAMPEGRMARVDSALVFGLSGPARLCNLPTVDKLLDHFPGCPEHAPAVLGSPSEPRRGVTFMVAPVIVRRRGGAVDLAILGSDGTGGLASRPLFPPAPRGDSRARGALTMGAPVRGTTSGAKDGVSPACVAVGGAPDETWTFTAPRAGLYALQLDSDYDGALAVYDADGALLACNDDRHSLVSSSLVHISLAQGARVKVVVDGFGGHAGAYTLRVQEEAPLAHGGVLVLGREVAGDTSKSTDDHAAYCASYGNDDEWLFDVTEDTTYVFRLETPGWTTVLSVLAEGASMPHLCTRERSPSSPLVTDAALAPGKYKIIVDGPNEKDAGPYRLRVERKTP
ncbi:hypothetical protein [Polyangium jinanense]|uniref:Peptidase C-terminal archaeal/bacterial domain-containing protein n=1 Tax=Polyangium jinanense TaxID=2829994 RepID=A0A9X3WZP9_9BACT|nr:hypothetical protein [Polyangium jinanense]MDC3954842.1 hypothetical protein [Polyangium jinanense]MDC3981387.1 hypothetical protein [Polyangium jinanense]